jgi:hypothetical protein
MYSITKVLIYSTLFLQGWIGYRSQTVCTDYTQCNFYELFSEVPATCLQSLFDVQNVSSLKGDVTIEAMVVHVPRFRARGPE